VFFGGYYGISFHGLATTYLMAIPFYTPTGTSMFLNSFVGDLMFSGILFGSYALVSRLNVLPAASANQHN
jgi:hypothetical protein